MANEKEPEITAEIAGDDPLYGPSFHLFVNLTALGTPEYFVEDHARSRMVEVTSEVFRDLVQLNIAGELNAIRRILDEALVSPDIEDTIANSLRRLTTEAR